MSYEIHIERRGPDAQRLPIALSEWRTVVRRTEGVRIAEDDSQATIPRTGEVIGLRNNGGNAEVFLPDKTAWIRAFHWSHSGRASFRAPRDFEVPASAIRQVALVLACGLNALLVGDEGEIFD